MGDWNVEVESKSEVEAVFEEQEFEVDIILRVHVGDTERTAALDDDVNECIGVR